MFAVLISGAVKVFSVSSFMISVFFVVFTHYFLLFIYLALLDLSFGMWHTGSFFF